MYNNLLFLTGFYNDLNSNSKSCLIINYFMTYTCGSRSSALFLACHPQEVGKDKITMHSKSVQLTISRILLRAI